MKLVLYFLLSFNLLCFSAQSQIITSSWVNIPGPDHEIIQSLGTVQGDNLLHNFEQFNLNSGESAVFQADPSISNIIADISKASFIDGSLVSPTNLFLINHESVTFGSNASLDISGSFSVESPSITLDGSQLVNFENDISLSGDNILIINSALLETSGYDAGRLALTGKSITVDNSYLYAQTTDGIGKSVEISGDTVSFINGSYLDASVTGSGHGSDVSITAKESAEFSGISTDGYPTEIYLASFTDGISGSFRLTSPTVSFLNGAWVSSYVHGTGTGADIEVIADNLTIDGEYEGEGGGLYSTVQPEGTGRGGNIFLDVESIDLLNGSYISTSTYGEGNGGNISINADNIYTGGATSLGWASLITASTDSTDAGLPTGNGGTVTIKTGNLILEGGSQVSTSSIGELSGNAGNIYINADTVIASGQNPHGENEDGLYSGVYAKATHAGGGQIKATTENQLYLHNGGTIQTSVGNGEGNGGDIEIGSRFVILNNGNIEANADAGDGGAIFIKTEHYIKSADSTVSASSRRGNDGTITITSPDTDVSKGLATLPGNMLDLSAWTKNTCSPAGKASRFTVQGKDNADVRIKGIQ